MLPEVIGAHEPLVADWADEVLLAGVGARVPGELVGPREPLGAAGPMARERSFACKAREGGNYLKSGNRGRERQQKLDVRRLTISSFPDGSAGLEVFIHLVQACARKGQTKYLPQNIRLPHTHLGTVFSAPCLSR